MARKFYTRPLGLVNGVYRPEDVQPEAVWRGVVSPDESELLIQTFGTLPGDAELSSGAIDTVCAAYGVSRSALEAVAVPGDPGGEDPTPPESDAWLEENWDYADTAAMIAAMEGAYTNAVSLESGTLFDETSGKFVRTQYPGGGASDYAGVTLGVSKALVDKPREVWGEAYIRLSSDWSIKSDDKTLFHMQDWRDVQDDVPGAGSSSVWRWDIYMRWPGGNPYGGAGDSPSVWDNWQALDWETLFASGDWFPLRWHFKMGSAPGVEDEIYRVWIDGVLVANRVNVAATFHTHANGFFRRIALGRNADPFGVGTRDWGRVRVFTSDPGWL